MTPVMTECDELSLLYDTVLDESPDFSLPQTLLCGQAFRWRQLDQNTFIGAAFEKVCQIAQTNGKIVDVYKRQLLYGALRRSIGCFRLRYNKAMHKSAKFQRTDISADHFILIDQDIRAYIVRLPGIIRHNVCIPLTPFSGIFFEIAALRLLDRVVVCKHVVKLLGDLHLDELIRLRFDLPAERL